MSELGQSDFKSGLLTDQIILGMPELKSCKLVLSEPQSENIFSANRLFIDTLINIFQPMKLSREIQQKSTQEILFEYDEARCR